LVLLAGLFAAFCLQISERQGRLAAVPNYDDAVYFLSATRLIEAGRAEGVNGVAEELRSEGLHSPWSVGLATGAFLIFGYVDWAPYAMNGLVIVGLLAALTWMWRELRWWEWGSGVVVFLAVPEPGGGGGDGNSLRADREMRGRRGGGAGGERTVVRGGLNL
jgi:hypothetical protein